MRKLLLLILICLPGLIFTISSLALAEEEKKKEGVIKLEQIVVTATKTEEKLIDVPASVTVITANDIKNSGAKTVGDVLRAVPGVDVQVYGTSCKYYNVNMRGFEGMGGYVKVLIDGIPANDLNGYFDQDALMNLENIERIEVVRGPTSALYGDNAMGGVINIITKKGTPTPETRLGISYGSFDSKEYTISTRGTKEMVSYSASFKREQEDSGYMDDTEWRNNVFNLRSDLALDEVSTLGFTLGFVKWNNIYAPSLTKEELEEDRRQNSSHYEEAEEDVWRVSLSYERDLTPSSRFSVTGYYRDSDYTCWMTFAGQNEWVSVEENVGGTIKYDWNKKIFNRENHLILGFDMRWDDSDYPTFQTNEAKKRTGLYRHRGFKRRLLASYIQNEFKILDPLTITVGARYDDIESGWEDHINLTDGDATNNAVSPKVGLLYELSDALSLYVNYGEAFLSPSTSKLSLSKDLDPEKAKSYEFGLKGALGEILIYEATYYNMQLKDKIVIEYYPDWSYEYKNIGKTKAQGVELGGEFFLLEGLSIPINYTYTESKYKDYTYYDYDPLTWQMTPVDCEDKNVVKIPKHKVNVGIRYNNPAGLAASITGKWVDKMYIDPMNNYKLDDHITFDARLSYDWKNWSCYLVGYNIFGKKYCDGAYYSGGVTKYYSMHEGYFMGGVSYKF